MCERDMVEYNIICFLSFLTAKDKGKESDYILYLFTFFIRALALSVELYYMSYVIFFSFIWFLAGVHLFS